MAIPKSPDPNERHFGMVLMSLRAIFILAACIIGVTGARAQDTSFAVHVATATAADHSRQILAFGTIHPDPMHLSAIVSMVGGRVVRVDTRPGQPVAKGDTPVTLLTAPSARENVANARDSIRLAEETLRRVEPLFKDGLVKKAEVDNAQRNLADAQAQLDSLRAIGATDPKDSPPAPAPGMVTDVLVQVGDEVAAGGALVRIADPRALVARIGIEPADLASLPTGTSVELTALTGLEAGDPAPPVVRSTISSVERLIDPNTNLVSVFAAFSGPSADDFMIGQTVRARFTLGAVPAIKVPRAALLYQGEAPVVFIARNGKAVRREVSIVDSSDGWVYLDDGIQSGDSVITQGQAGLSDGDTVRIAP